MKWFIVWAALSSHPKWLALTMEQRGAWVTLMCFASAAQPRWRLRNRKHAELLLQRDGAADAAGTVDALVSTGLLDEASDDELEVHDHAAWQPALSETPEAWAERKRRSRERRRTADVGTNLVTTGHEVVTHVPITSREEERQRKTRRRRDRSDFEAEDFVPSILGAQAVLREGWGRPDLTDIERDALAEAASERKGGWYELIEDLLASDSDDPIAAVRG